VCPEIRFRLQAVLVNEAFPVFVSCRKIATARPRCFAYWQAVRVAALFHDMKCLGALSLMATVSLFIAGCGNAPPSTAATPTNVALPAFPTAAQPRLQTLKLWLGSQEMVAELALTPEQRQIGMMFRTNMAENEGMLFVFPVPHQTAFWMKNTIVPLSAAYIDANGVIQEIHELKPHDTNAVEATSHEIQFVLETPQGWFQRNNVSTGAVIRTERGALRETFSRQP
jgi:uncharacterized protein